MTNYLLKRAYSPAEASDGYRVYIDRLWPRGLSHETFQYDLWEKEISPSTELREWFHAAGDAAWPQFEKRYTEELAANRPESAADAMTKLTYSRELMGLQ